ncbi:IclR family transcriptional regulator [Pseudalkalibacillus caeni]|uniref:IclR family transcriptional regulator n=1 Tax=Exobacillus caeni TaxID=2574798 RepID=A0A5R9FFR6_9BACL|nr:helix-turn-helix domain-containing protein [Pseudalkalibacillus caeni]TLS38405.1 hypothetical protein FCL54_04490 [Pseudalkalibacillus caeni]
MTKLSKSGSVEKALSIIDCFTNEHSRYTLEELTRVSGFPRSTVYRMLCSLERFGYIIREIVNREVFFSLGFRFLEKASMVIGQIDLRELARQEMSELRRHTGMTVQLAVKDREEAVYIDQMETNNYIRVYPEIE